MQCFNPTLIQLRVLANLPIIPIGFLFQSHPDPIARGFDLGTFHDYVRFNPTLIQLRENPGDTHVDQDDCFNPTLIQLRAVMAALQHLLKSCFNPTLIQLRVNVQVGNILVVPLFQSHPDPIASISGIWVMIMVYWVSIPP